MISSYLYLVTNNNDLVSAVFVNHYRVLWENWKGEFKWKLAKPQLGIIKHYEVDKVPTHVALIKKISFDQMCQGKSI